MNRDGDSRRLRKGGIVRNASAQTVGDEFARPGRVVGFGLWIGFSTGAVITGARCYDSPGHGTRRPRGIDSLRLRAGSRPIVNSYGLENGENAQRGGAENESGT